MWDRTVSMMQIRYFPLLFFCLVTLTAEKCPKGPDISDDVLAKIAFDYSNIDETGLRRGTVGVDYEFCIPATDEALQEVMKIDPKVKVMQKSKGRIGCTEGQWLCINSTHTDQWKEKLYAIAALEFVERIQETVYE